MGIINCKVFINKFCRISLIPVFLLFIYHAAAAQTFADIHGALKIEDGRVVNSSGQPPQLRGISFSWSIWGGKKYYNTQVVDWLIRDFKVSLIRLSMAIEPAGGFLHHPKEQKELITRIADYALDKGIYVIIDWHDHNADRNIKEAKQFFAEMAQRYASRPNIIYEIWNEPERQSWKTVKTYSEEVIGEIRKYDPLNLIIAGSPHWDQDVDIAASDPIKGFENIAYSFHFYASDLAHQEELMAKAESAIHRKLPLFVTEWGVGEANGDGEFNLAKTEKWLNWMEKHRLSWANWNITDKKETTALLLPKTQASGQWKISQLTPAGKYIREKLRELHAAVK